MSHLPPAASSAACQYDRFGQCRIAHTTQAEHFLDHGTAEIERMADRRRILSDWWRDHGRAGTGWWAGTE